MKRRINFLQKERLVRPFLVILICSFLSFQGIAVAINPLYTIENVQIDVQEASATHARSEAIRQAQRKALQQLLLRLISNLSTEDAIAKMISNLSDSVIEIMIEDFEIEQEKISATRYKGSFTLHFKGEKVQQFIATHNKTSNNAFSNLRTSITLILPIQQQKGKLLLWEEANEWRQCWMERGTPDENSYISPLGDLKDKTSLTSVAAKQGGPGVYQSLMNRYQANHVLVAILNQDETPSTLQLSLYSARGLEWTKPSSSFIENNNISLCQKALNQTLEALRTLNPTTFFQQRPTVEIQCLISFTNFKNWRDIQHKLTENPLIRSQALNSLSLYAATVTLTLMGDTKTVADSLRTQNFLVEELSQNSSHTLLRIRTREMLP